MSPRRPRRQSGRERGEKKQDGQTATDKREREKQSGRREQQLAAITAGTLTEIST
jgi:hypothetical protein